MAEKESPVTVEMTEEPKENEEKPAKPKIKNVSVLIGERTVPLRLTTPGIIQIEEDLDMDIEELRETMNNLKKKNTRLMIKTLRILGNEGLRLKGEAPDLTDEELMDKIPAHNILLYRVGVLAAIAKGMFMETDDSEEEKQDVVLNEILKKNTSSQGEGSGATD